MELIRVVQRKGKEKMKDTSHNPPELAIKKKKKEKKSTIVMLKPSSNDMNTVKDYLPRMNGKLNPLTGEVDWEYKHYAWEPLGANDDDFDMVNPKV